MKLRLGIPAFSRDTINGMTNLLRKYYRFVTDRLFLICEDGRKDAVQFLVMEDVDLIGEEVIKQLMGD